ncbi:MAG: RtcB family protein [Proteobacteria bacterium]|nr:RtcB family protein [Pseudomonadota bacterium]
MGRAGPSGQDAEPCTNATVRRTLGGVQIEGIVGNTRRTPLDECAHVYKDLDEVLAVLVNNGIAEVAHRLWPVANLKGTD